MVDFRTELRQATFRGIGFHVPDDDSSAGRRIVTHEFPGRDEPVHEDLGMTVRSFSMRAVIIGSGYVAQAAALEEACLQPGAGTLVHPHYGEMQVVVKDVRRQHSGSAIGEVSFSITFERTGALVGVDTFGDTARQLSFAASNLYTVASGGFTQSLLTSALPAFVLGDGLGRLNGFMDLAQQILGYYGLNTLFDFIIFDTLDASNGDTVAALFKGIAAQTSSPDTPVIGAAPITNTLDPIAAVRAFTAIAAADMDADIAPTTPSRAAINSNASAISTLVKANALAAAGEAASNAQYESRDQALAVRDLMADGLTSLRDRQLTDGSFSGFRASSSLLVAVTQDISEQLGRLPSTAQVTSAAVRPSLALAYRLYGDEPAAIFSRAGDIVKRNRIPHPGFIGVKPLEVLING